MKALTIHQPWASLLASGAKHIETRSWGTTHRGPLAIHASRTTDAAMITRLEQYFPHLADLLGRDLPTGAVLAVGTLTDVVEMTPDWIAEQTPQERALGFYEVGRFGWQLSDVQPLPRPVKCRGRMRVWALPEEVRLEIEGMLPGMLGT